ncbi:hypothetical protein F0U61_51130 [Archangium violaceum]|uniref:hypothetical protein n=1 Tax=Archangium violaceum TaxID=83451 RepID=UPI002B2F7227|nr:hypothetical protein F0U61_51130 [Archangium violaceum]
MLLSSLGCQPEHPEEAEPFTQAEQELRIANSLTTRALVYNAISTNPVANNLVANNALAPLFAPSSGDAYLTQQLRDVDAQHFMSYLVSCALKGTQSITWMDLATLTPKTWKGKAGLCPEWANQAPSEECKRRVSACILARNNAFGRRVELSLRGEDPSDINRFALEPKTASVDHDPDLAQDVPSYQACTTPQLGANRNCGWKPDYIGRCVPGQTVRLGAGGKAPDQCAGGSVLGSVSGNMVLRVCDGIVGCDNASARKLAQNQGSCGTTLPAVTFTCPASGEFNVMTAPFDSALSGTAHVGVETGTPAGTSYGLSEKAVFSYREGAFYGTLFDASALAAKVFVNEEGVVVGKEQRIKGSVYTKMFSCHAPEWSQGMAYATSRVCAQPGTGLDCAATVTGACFTPWDQNFPASVCEVEDGPLVSGDGDFERCMDPAKGMWKEPITVYLHAPCDVVSAKNPELCAWRRVQK